jgi:hypothetical protein
MIRQAIRLCVWALCIATPEVAAQDKHEIAPGQFLTNEYGELCTMCEADVTCTASDGAATAYHFQKRTFLSQMSTVLDYFPFTKGYGLKHSRPVIADGAREGRAAFDLNTKRIDLPDNSWIDRSDGSWHAADGSAKGQCKEKVAP